MSQDIEKYVHYFPAACAAISFADIDAELASYFPTNDGTKRASFIVGQNISYDDYKVVAWCQVPTVELLRNFIAGIFGITPDYCLVHRYGHGAASIMWHNDKEALDSDIFSISFGATRKFRLRSMWQTTGFQKEFLLHSGDLIWMKTGCQRKYKHCVPKELKVKAPRINLTFRTI